VEEAVVADLPSEEEALDAYKKGEVDAVADSEPIGTLLVASGKVRNVVDQSNDAPYKDEYCCAVVVNGSRLCVTESKAMARVESA